MLYPNKQWMRLAAILATAGMLMFTGCLSSDTSDTPAETANAKDKQTSATDNSTGDDAESDASDSSNATDPLSGQPDINGMNAQELADFQRALSKLSPDEVEQLTATIEDTGFSAAGIITPEAAAEMLVSGGGNFGMLLTDAPLRDQGVEKVLINVQRIELIRAGYEGMPDHDASHDKGEHDDHEDMDHSAKKKADEDGEEGENEGEDEDDGEDEEDVEDEDDMTEDEEDVGALKFLAQDDSDADEGTANSEEASADSDDADDADVSTLEATTATDEEEGDSEEGSDGTGDPKSDTSDDDDQKGHKAARIIISDEPMVIDLLALQNDVTTALGGGKVPAGTYSQIRFILAEDNEIVVNGETFPLKVPSGTSSGLKIKGKFVVTDDAPLLLTLDFDAEQSVHVAGNKDNPKYMLKPVLMIKRQKKVGKDGKLSDDGNAPHKDTDNAHGDAPQSHGKGDHDTQGILPGEPNPNGGDHGKPKDDDSEGEDVEDESEAGKDDGDDTDANDQEDDTEGGGKGADDDEDNAPDQPHGKS